MTPVLTTDAMREADRLTIEEYGIAGFTLMETAGRAAADAIERRYGPMQNARVTILCGKGNNGGDGLVVARVLYERGARVTALTLAEADGMSPDAAQNLRLLHHLAEADAERRLTVARFESMQQVAAFTPPAVFVDALLGTGLTSDLRDPISSLVDWLNEQPQPTVALDIPTGLHGDLGTVLGTAVRADLTVTMAAPKAGMLIGEGPAHTGVLEVAEIGIPRFVLDRVVQHDGCAYWPADEDISGWLPRRAPDAHKYSVGLALVVGGAAGMTGAPVMASLAAARVGAGFVTCACAASLQPILAAKLTAVTTLALPEADRDGIDPAGALDALAPRLEKARALLVGPGLGRNPATQRFIRDLLERAEQPIVVDADGLNALAGHTDLLAEHADGRWVLTPHAGEFERLAGSDVDLSDRIQVARRYARQWNCVLILKGLPSIVGTPSGRVYVNRTGNPALATAGTGDVLAGMCTGLLAQGLSAEQAAVCALHIGGAAADRYAAHAHPQAMMATDLLDEVPLVLHERFASIA